MTAQAPAVTNPFVMPASWSQIQIEVTTDCSLKCQGCQHTIGGKTGNWQSRHMTLEVFSTLLGHCPPAGSLMLHGLGEPTLNPHLPDLIDYARSHAQYVNIGFSTNALTQDTDYFLMLKAKGLTSLAVSVDALSQPIADQTRQGTDVSVLQNRLAELLTTGLAVSCVVVLSRRNLAHFAELLDRLLSLGIGLVEVVPFSAYTPEDADAKLSPEDFALSKDLIKRAQEKFPGQRVHGAAAFEPNGNRCRRPLQTLYITIDGYLTPCYTSDNASLYGGTNLLTQDFSHAWTSPGMAQWMSDYLLHEPDMCQGCFNNPSGSYAKINPLSTIPDHQIGASLEKMAGDKLRTGHNIPAANLYRAQLEIIPTARGYRGLAEALRLQGQTDESVAIATEGVRRFPQALENVLHLAELYISHDQRAQAMDLFYKLAAFNVGKERHEIACVAFDRLLTMEGCDPYLLNLIHPFRLSAEMDRAIRACRYGLSNASDDLALKLSLAISQLPMIPSSIEQSQSQRGRYTKLLEEFCSDVERTKDQNALAKASDAVGLAKPFFLSYGGQQDKELQSLYGKAIHKIMAARYPQWSLPLKPHAPNSKLKIGFVSAYWHLHSISKLFGGWIRHLDRKKFEVYGYVLDMTPMDSWGQSLMSTLDYCRTHKGTSTTEDWASILEKDAVDVLIYLEIGMDPTSLRLASLRFAPVQVTTWGHPVTSGLPTIDYFITSKLMEPAKSESHYTEELVTLPGTSLCYLPLPPQQSAELTRAKLGISDESIVFMCCQSLFKYRPEEDWVFIELAQQIPDARFLFVANPPGRPARLFIERLRRVFDEAGIDHNNHLAMTTPVPTVNFESLLHLGDIYLDSLVWSGGNTTLEAIQAGMPMVTLKGEFMRGRHSSALLEHLGLEDLIAADPKDYIRKAVALAKDATLRKKIAERVLSAAPKLFNDQKPIRALENFFIKAVNKRRTKNAGDPS